MISGEPYTLGLWDTSGKPFHVTKYKFRKGIVSCRYDVSHLTQFQKVNVH